MKVRHKLDQREGESTQFNKEELDQVLIRFDNTGGETKSVSVSNVEVWLEERGQKFMDFKTALANRFILISGGPTQFVEH